MKELERRIRELEHRLERAELCIQQLENRTIYMDEDTDDVEIHCLGISCRTANTLCRAGIKTKRELMQLSIAQIERIKGIGKESQREIERYLREECQK